MRKMMRHQKYFSVRIALSALFILSLCSTKLGFVLSVQKGKNAAGVGHRRVTLAKSPHSALQIERDERILGPETGAPPSTKLPSMPFGGKDKNTGTADEDAAYGLPGTKELDNNTLPGYPTGEDETAEGSLTESNQEPGFNAGAISTPESGDDIPPPTGTLRKIATTGVPIRSKQGVLDEPLTEETSAVADQTQEDALRTPTSKQAASIEGPMTTATDSSTAPALNEEPGTKPPQQTEDTSSPQTVEGEIPTGEEVKEEQPSLSSECTADLKEHAPELIEKAPGNCPRDIMEKWELVYIMYGPLEGIVGMGDANARAKLNLPEAYFQELVTLQAKAKERSMHHDMESLPEECKTALRYIHCKAQDRITGCAVTRTQGTLKFSQSDFEVADLYCYLKNSPLYQMCLSAAKTAGPGGDAYPFEGCRAYNDKFKVSSFAPRSSPLFAWLFTAAFALFSTFLL